MSEIDFGCLKATKKTFASTLTDDENETTSEPVWKTIIDKYNKDRQELENYIKKRDAKEDDVTLDHHPVIAYLNKTVFPHVCEAMISMLEKVRDENSFYRQKSAFNGIDYLSEYLYNTNPNYPERQENWIYIFDMKWVENHLKYSPRPYYPFSLIWTREYAATKIQSFMRGYWVRRRDYVQEVRNFWKEYKLSEQAKAIK